VARPTLDGSPRPILFVTNDFPTRVGGIETFVVELCKALSPDEVVVYTASMPGDHQYDAGLAFPVYRDPNRMLLPTPTLARRVAEVMNVHGCDRVVFGASVPLGLLAPSLRRAGARRLVAITHGHEVWWARLPGTRGLLRRVGDSVDVMTYVSEWCRTRVAKALSPEARSRLLRLSPGVDPSRFYPGCGANRVREQLGIDPATPLSLCLARLVPRKGQDVLIRAWPAVLTSEPDAILLLVGDGPRRASLARLVERLGVQDSVMMLHGVRWDEVPAYMDAADVFAMPCRSRRFGLEVEAWGIVYLEAQACGVPVVIGASGGAPETLSGPNCGEIVSGAVPEVADALTRLLRAHGGTPPHDRQGRASWTWAAASSDLARMLRRQVG
jgi:phosphatidyl-myo-inositol dimannoside synthase